MFVQNGEMSLKALNFYHSRTSVSYNFLYYFCGLYSLYDLYFIAVDKPCIIIAGGYNIKPGGGEQALNSVEVISGFQRVNMELPKLPKEITKSKIFTECLMFIHDGALMVCGGKNYIGKEPWKCYQFNNGTWREHSTLKRNRSSSLNATTVKGTFIFGGDESKKSYEYLPIGSKKWKIGKLRQSRDGFCYGIAIQVKSKEEIWLFEDDIIFSFDINSHAIQELPFKLIKGREYHAGAFIPGTCKILVTGGISGEETQNTCEIIDTENATVTMASPMNSKRSSHGMGIIKVNGEERLAVFGGLDDGTDSDHRSVELYNTKTQKWELAENFAMNISRYDFGYVNNI